MSQYTPQIQVIPADLAESKASGKNLKFLVGGLLLIGLVIAFMVQATMSTGTYYMTGSELHGRSASLVGERVRVSGCLLYTSRRQSPNLPIPQSPISNLLFTGAWLRRTAAAGCRRWDRADRGEAHCFAGAVQAGLRLSLIHI